MHFKADTTNPDMMNKTNIAGTSITRRELLVVSFVLIASHLLLWVRYLPLAHKDLSFYTEPALLLATQGVIAGPGSQHVDLMYRVGLYFYPPGYFLLLGSWIKLFGFGVHSLLAYTHIVHATFLLLLWVLLRARFGCGYLATTLALLSAFPFFNHGRPDLSALLLGCGAWLVVPRSFCIKRLLASAVLLGGAILISPAFGISSAAVVASFHFFSSDGTWRQRISSGVFLTGITTIVFISLACIIITWQRAWPFALEQFSINASIRGKELNQMPDLTSPYALAFSVIPLGLLTLPLIIGLFYRSRFQPDSARFVAAASYLISFLALFVLSKSALLLWQHFMLLARPVLFGVAASSGKLLGRVGIVLLVIYTTITIYYEKRDFLFITADMEREFRAVESIKLDPNLVIAVDSHFSPIVYIHGKTLNYEVYMLQGYWRRYRAATSPTALMLLPEDERERPQEPDLIIISAISLDEAGVPDPNLYVPIDDAAAEPRLKLLGRAVNLPQHPLHCYLFKRKSL